MTPHETRTRRVPAAPGTPGLLRSINDREVLGLLLDHGSLTRTRLAELTGLSKPTVAQVLTRLAEAQLVTDVGAATGTRGPNAAVYGPVVDRAVGVAVDVRPFDIYSTVVDAVDSPRPVAHLALPRRAGERDMVGEVTGALAGACRAAGVPEEAVATFTLGLQGAVDPRTDDLRFSSDLPGWPRRGLRSRLAQHVSVPFRFDNDVNLAALAEREHLTAAGTEVEALALLWMGEGLGVAVQLEGRMHRGASGGAGEIGYLPVPRAATAFEPQARELQDLIGGPAVARLARRHGLHGRTYEAVLERLADHPARSAILADLAPRVATGVVPVLAVMDPDLIVLGGPTGAVGGQELAGLVRDHVRRTSRWAPTVHATRVPDHPVLTGARRVVAADLRAGLLDAVP